MIEKCLCQVLFLKNFEIKKVKQLIEKEIEALKEMQTETYEEFEDYIKQEIDKLENILVSIENRKIWWK